MNLAFWKPKSPFAVSAIRLAESDYARRKSLTKPPDQTVPSQIIIQPSDRWQYTQSRRPLPSNIESIMTMGLDGNLCDQHKLFSVQVDTWPKLASNLRTLKSAASQAPFCVHPWVDGDGDVPEEASRRMRIVESALWGMRPDECELEMGAEGMFEALAEGSLWGHTVLQPLWEMRDMPDGSRAMMPRAVQMVDPLHYGYPGSDSESRKDRLMLTEPNSRRFTPFPENEFIIQIVRAHRDHPSVSAPMRSLTKFWLGATYGWEWLLTYAQLFGAPFRWANYDSSNTQNLAAVSAMLSNMGHAGWAAFPDGVDVKWIETQKSGGELPQMLVQETADLAADLVVLGHTQQTKQNVGSKATEIVRGEVRGQTIVNVCGRVAATLTGQFVRAVCFLNFGNYDYMPEIRCNMPDALLTLDEITSLEKLLDMGQPIAQEWTSERYGIPLPREGQTVLRRIADAAPGVIASRVRASGANSYRKDFALRPGLQEVYEILLESEIADASDILDSP